MSPSGIFLWPPSCCPPPPPLRPSPPSVTASVAVRCCAPRTATARSCPSASGTFTVSAVLVISGRRTGASVTCAVTIDRGEREGVQPSVAFNGGADGI